MPETYRTQQGAQGQAGGNGPLAEAGSSHLPAGAPIGVRRCQPSGIAYVADHVGRHGRQPQEEAGPVDEKPLSLETGAGEQQNDATGEEHDCKNYNEGPQHSEQGGWGPLRRYAGEPV